jgi:hypothetical protein
MLKRWQTYAVVFAAIVAVTAGGFYLYVQDRRAAPIVGPETPEVGAEAPLDVEKKPPSAVDTPSPADAR